MIVHNEAEISRAVEVTVTQRGDQSSHIDTSLDMGPHTRYEIYTEVTMGIVRGLGAAFGGLLSISFETIAFAPLAGFVGIVVGEVVGDVTDWVLSVILG